MQIALQLHAFGPALGALAAQVAASATAGRARRQRACYGVAWSGAGLKGNRQRAPGPARLGGPDGERCTHVRFLKTKKPQLMGQGLMRHAKRLKPWLNSYVARFSRGGEPCSVKGVEQRHGDVLLCKNLLMISSAPQRRDPQHIPRPCQGCSLAGCEAKRRLSGPHRGHDNGCIGVCCASPTQASREPR